MFSVVLHVFTQKAEDPAAFIEAFFSVSCLIYFEGSSVCIKKKALG